MYLHYAYNRLKCTLNIILELVHYMSYIQPCTTVFTGEIMLLDSQVPEGTLTHLAPDFYQHQICYTRPGVVPVSLSDLQEEV